MIECLSITLRALNYGNYGTFLTMGNAGFLSLTISQVRGPFCRDQRPPSGRSISAWTGVHGILRLLKRMALLNPGRRYPAYESFCGHWMVVPEEHQFRGIFRCCSSARIRNVCFIYEGGARGLAYRVASSSFDSHCRISFR